MHCSVMKTILDIHVVTPVFGLCVVMRALAGTSLDAIEWQRNPLFACSLLESVCSLGWKCKLLMWLGAIFWVFVALQRDFIPN